MNRSDEAITTTLTAPHDLDDFPAYAQAAAKLTELRRQEDDLAARLAAAIRRMHETCFNRPIPPPGHDREINELRQRIVTLKAEICAAEQALRAAAGEASIAISTAAKPAHDKLRARVIAALVELRDALDCERCFRVDMDNRGVLSHNVITPATVPDLAEPARLEAIINTLREE